METILFSISIFSLSVIKFLGLETSPPAFYADEAAGATQVLCLKQTGQDFFGHAYPLFTPGLGGGYYTAPFLYGESLWTSFFGNSVASFRAFSAFVTTLAIFFLWAWLRKRVNSRAALFAALFASMIPWSFQLARLAWDPPLAPLFLMLGLWCLDLKSKWASVYGALAFALAAYAYPPSRIQVAILLCVLPGFNLRQKLKIFGVFILANVPMFYQAWVDPGFTARGKMLAITSSYPGNPYHDAGVFGLISGFVQQFFAHLSPEFLFVSGDHNLRHSLQTVGGNRLDRRLNIDRGRDLFWYTKCAAPKDKSFKFIHICTIRNRIRNYSGRPHLGECAAFIARHRHLAFRRDLIGA